LKINWEKWDWEIGKLLTESGGQFQNFPIQKFQNQTA